MHPQLTDLIGLGDFLELFLGHFSLADVPVRMPLQRRLFVRLPNQTVSRNVILLNHVRKKIILNGKHAKSVGNWSFCWAV